MKRAFAISVVAELSIALLLLHSDIKDFLWTHPWWHSFLVLVPTISVPILAALELVHSREANRLRADLGKRVARIGELQTELNTLQDERNKSLNKIAINTERRLSEADRNAAVLRKYLGKSAQVTEGANSWGSMGAVVAEVNDNNIATLFVPSGFASSQAFGQRVRCDKVQIVEEPVGSCPVQIHILERYGGPTSYGEAKSWEERSARSNAMQQVPHGRNVFAVSYRKDGTSTKRGVYIYQSTDGSPNYSLVAFEDLEKPQTTAWYLPKIEIEKRFAILQLEWLNSGWRYDGGSGSGPLFLLTRP